MSEPTTEPASDPLSDPLADPLRDPLGDPLGDPAPADATDPAQAGQPAGSVSVTEGEGDTLAVPLAELRPSLEALLMIADQPMDALTLASAVGYPADQVTDALFGLAAEYTVQGRGFELRNVAGGWRYYTREEFAAVVEAFVLDGQQARLTQAALETLAVVAYKQPVSRTRVSAIRGVSVDGVMRTLLTRGLVEECGQDEETGATLYRTTGYFLERIGLSSLDELPELAPYLPDMGDVEDELQRIGDSVASLAVGAASEAAEAAAGEPTEAESADSDEPDDDASADEPRDDDDEPPTDEATVGE